MVWNRKKISCMAAETVKVVPLHRFFYALPEISGFHFTNCMVDYTEGRIFFQRRAGDDFIRGEAAQAAGYSLPNPSTNLAGYKKEEVLMSKTKYVHLSAVVLLLLLAAFFLRGAVPAGVETNVEGGGLVTSQEQDETADVVKDTTSFPPTEFSHEGAPLKTESVDGQQGDDAQEEMRQEASQRYALLTDPAVNSRGTSQDRASRGTSSEGQPADEETGLEKEDVSAEADSKVELSPWYGEAENIFSIGTEAKVIDVETGLSFEVRKTYGHNHADVETLTAEDTEKMKKIAGGEWSWERRAVIVEVGDHRIAASATLMPHAGRDDKPANAHVNDRSGGYGAGDNLDAVKGNNMDGHFDIHFYKSRTHATGRIDRQAQEMVQKAYRSASESE